MEELIRIRLEELQRLRNDLIRKQKMDLAKIDVRIEELINLKGDNSENTFEFDDSIEDDLPEIANEPKDIHDEMENEEDNEDEDSILEEDILEQEKPVIKEKKSAEEITEELMDFIDTKEDEKVDSSVGIQEVVQELAQELGIEEEISTEMPSELQDVVDSLESVGDEDIDIIIEDIAATKKEPVVQAENKVRKSDKETTVVEPKAKSGKIINEDIGALFDGTGEVEA